MRGCWAPQISAGSRSCLMEKEPGGDVQAASFREGSRRAFASEKEPCVGVNVVLFLWCCSPSESTRFSCCPSSKTGQIEEGFQHSCHTGFPPDFMSAACLYATCFFLCLQYSSVSLFACKTSIPFFIIQGMSLRFPRLWWEEFF